MCAQSCSYKLTMSGVKEINLAFKLRLCGRGDGISRSGSKEESLVNWLGQGSKTRVWLLGGVSWGWGTSKFVIGLVVHRHKSGSLVLKCERTVFPLKQKG